MNQQVAESSVEPISEKEDQFAHGVVDAALKVHSALGPGLLESVYETCLCHELSRRGIHHEKQVALPIVYDGLQVDAGLRMDLVVGDSVIVELKAVEKLLPLHTAQMLTYLKLSGHRLGLLINFNVPLLKSGIKRVAL